MFGKKHAAESGKKKYLYMFEEGNKDMRELLGGKGANLAEMTNAGMPVPPGFTITTEACTQYYTDGRQINEDIIKIQVFFVAADDRTPADYFPAVEISGHKQYDLSSSVRSVKLKFHPFHIIDLMKLAIFDLQ